MIFAKNKLTIGTLENNIKDILLHSECTSYYKDIDVTVIFKQVYQVNDIKGDVMLAFVGGVISINGTISGLLKCCYILMAWVNKPMAFERSNFKVNGPKQ